MADPQPHPTRPSWFRPMPLLLGLGIGAVAAAYPLLGEEYRPFNFAAFGAIGLFVAARVGLLPALLLALGSKLVGDALLYYQHDQDPMYLPSRTVYVCLALYPVLGYFFLRRTESPVRIGGVAVLGGLQFFLITNFMSWRGQSLPYAAGIEGLFQSYWAALPFHRGTLVSDLTFTAVLFGLHAVLSRAYFPAERVALEPVLQPEVVR